VIGLACVVCDATYPADFSGYVCPHHGDEGILDVTYDYESIGTSLTKGSLAADPDRTMWRYGPLLPISSDAVIPPLSVGGTPMYDAPRLAGAVGIGELWVKDEGRQPTASLKDRASAMAVAKAIERGEHTITTASTGNAAAALAGMAASVDLQSIIFAPAAAPEAKIAQLLVYGATVVLVDGSYTDAFELCMEAATEYGWYNRNTGFNPYMTEGKKTAGLEILEDFGWDPPDAIFVSVGDGSIIGGVHKAMKDALALGWIDRSPRLYGIQAAGSDYLVQAFEAGEDVLTKPAIEAATVADSISADLPRDRVKAMAAVIDTGGAFLRVTDDEILDAVPTLARGSGVFAEPAGAAPYAGVIAAAKDGLIGADDAVVVIASGSGLKDTASAMRAAAMAGTEPIRIEPTLDALKARL
jgi:threonine synthase